MKNILMSALVLNGSRSGYRRIVRNLILHYNANPHKYRLTVVIQDSGFDSLGLEIDTLANVRLVIIRSYRSKWMRGIAEQILIPVYALMYRAHRIFMPATFGLALPLVPVVAFIHTNTNFQVDSKLKGRSKYQQWAHALLIRITAFTSRTLVFTTEQTYDEYCRYLSKRFDKNILGNGLTVASKVNFAPIVSKLLDHATCPDYFLSVSQIYRLKNFDTLIKAFISLKEEQMLPGNKLLVIVGTIQEVEFFKELERLSYERKDIYFLQNIEESELNALYQGSSGYCFFSYFEGYSLTPGEALMSGLRVALSDIPVHREVYGDLAVYADPFDLKSVKDAIYEIHRNPILHASLDDLESRLSFDEFIKRLENSFEL
jgi:glycosyltransferase involved in cell wall biosynthesis